MLLINHEVFTTLLGLIIYHVAAQDKGLYKKNNVDSIIADSSYIFSTKTSSSACDMTANFCDINCCTDQECSEDDQKVFICDNKTEALDDNLHFMECRNKIFLRESPFGHAFCLESSNTPYLGDFYHNDNLQLLNSEDINKILKIKYSNMFNDKTYKKPDDSLLGYKYGTNLRLMNNLNLGTNAIFFPKNIFDNGGGPCSKNYPIQFMIASKSICYHTITAEECILNQIFNLDFFLKKENPHFFIDNGSGEEVKMNIFLKCVKNGTKYVTFSSSNINVQKYYQNEVEHIEDCSRRILKPKFNSKTSLCENVVVDVRYDFIRNHTNLVNATAVFVLADIPTDIGSFFASTKEYTYEKTMDYNEEEIIDIVLRQNLKVNFENLKGFSKTLSKKEGYTIGAQFFR